MFSNLLSFFSASIGIDLGTANVLVYVKGRGVVINEPSYVAIDRNTKKVLAVGAEAKRWASLAPQNIEVIRPMSEGVISDYEVSEQMLRYFITRATNHNSFTQLKVVIAVPYKLNAVNQRAVKDSAYRAGAHQVELLEEPIASALGVGLPVGEPGASMIIDMGGGTTEIAVISLGGIAAANSLPIGGDALEEAIIKKVELDYNLDISRKTAEILKKEIGSAWELPTEKTFEIRGRDRSNRNLPKAITITSQEVREAMMECFKKMAQGVRDVLGECKPEISSDLYDRGAALAGGGALIRGLDQFLSAETGLPVFVAEEPLYAVVKGTGVVIENSEWNRHAKV
ncbi:MAG: rod shape-determining protein [Opitutales bacterium]|nr:rod shape-determining protein [Opitutales bacterium]